MNYDDIELAPNARWVHESSAEVGIKQIDGHTGSVKSVQLIDNDSKIFTASDDYTARIWDFVSGREINCFSNLHENCISKARVNQETNKFITCSWDKSIKCWDLETGKLLWRNDHAYLLTSCDFSHHGKYVVSASDVDYNVSVWDSQTGKRIDTIHDLHTSTITSCQFSPKNDRIVTTSMDKSTKFYDMVAKKLTITLGSHSNIISNCSFTPDERTFATCSWDKTINIWDISTGMYRKEGPTTMSKGHEGSISSCYLSLDGTLCVSGGYDSRLVLWDMDHASAKLVLRGHSDWLNDVTLTQDNRWIVSVGKDHEIREWDICNSDNIKLVIEQNRNLGNKLIKCSICLRTFTISKLQKTGEMKMLCVFCRLQEQALINNEIDPAYLFTNNE